MHQLVTASATTTTATATTIATVSATASATFYLRTGFVDVQSAAPELSTVQGGDGFVSIFGVGHLHKTKAARASGVAVGHDADPVYLSVCLEHLPQFFFRSVEVEVANKNILQANRLYVSYLRVTDFGGKAMAGWPSYSRSR
jgi:hypothetical protein